MLCLTPQRVEVLCLTLHQHDDLEYFGRATDGFFCVDADESAADDVLAEYIAWFGSG